MTASKGQFGTLPRSLVQLMAGEMRPIDTHMGQAEENSIAAAGIMTNKPFLEHTAEDMQEAYAVNASNTYLQEKGTER